MDSCSSLAHSLKLACFLQQWLREILQQVQGVSPWVAVFSRCLGPGRTPSLNMTYGNFGLEFMTERERMRSNVKALFSIASKSKLPFVLAFSSQIQRWVPHWNDIHKNSTGTYHFQSSGMPRAFLLSAKDSIFLFVGSRMLACLLVFNVQEGFNATCLLDQGKANWPRAYFCKESFVFVLNTATSIYLLSLATFEHYNSDVNSWKEMI